MRPASKLEKNIVCKYKFLLNTYVWYELRKFNHLVVFHRHICLRVVSFPGYSEISDSSLHSKYPMLGRWRHRRSWDEVWSVACEWSGSNAELHNSRFGRTRARSASAWKPSHSCVSPLLLLMFVFQIALLRADIFEARLIHTPFAHTYLLYSHTLHTPIIFTPFAPCVPVVC